MAGVRGDRTAPLARHFATYALFQLDGPAWDSWKPESEAQLATPCTGGAVAHALRALDAEVTFRIPRFSSAPARTTKPPAKIDVIW